MSVKVFKTNKAGKIEFTRCELEKLLNETYNEGYRDGENHAKSNYWTWTSPSVTNTPYYSTITCDNGSALRSITDSITGSVTGDTSVATVNTVNLADKVIACDSAIETPTQTNSTITVEAMKAPENAVKVSLGETPSRTYEAKGVTYNMNDLAKTIDSILNGNFNMDSLFALPSLNSTSAKTANDPMTNLAKELRGL